MYENFILGVVDNSLTKAGLKVVDSKVTGSQKDDFKKF